MKNLDKKVFVLIGISSLFFLFTIVLAGLYIAELSEENPSEVKFEDIASDIVTNIDEVDSSDHLFMQEYLNSLPAEDLSEEETEGLLLMREEEKLAHDVYTVLYEKWGQRIFNNISDSEQTHTDSVKDLLEKYDIEDPVEDDAIGSFADAELAELYSSLIEKGEESLVDALTVGAIVEDLDIYDLERLMQDTDNEDILVAYQNLLKGSRNHIRAYTRMLNRNGETYTPQYISLNDYQEITGAASENGITYDASGNELE